MVLRGRGTIPALTLDTARVRLPAVYPALRRRIAARRPGDAVAVARTVLSRFPLEHPSGGWQLGRPVCTANLVAVPAGESGGPATVMVKVARTDDEAAALGRHVEALRHLHRDRRLDRWRHHLPHLMGAGTVGPRTYLAETLLPGRSVDAAAWTTSTIGRALRTLDVLHHTTAYMAPVDWRHLEAWIDEPARLVRGLLDEDPGGVDALARACERATADLVGRTLQLGWIHGDFWLGNILVWPDGSVSGIVDWELAEPDQPPFHDVLHAVLYRPRRFGGRELGGAIAALLRRPHLPAQDQALLDRSGAGADPLELRTMLLIYWLRYVRCLGSRPSHGGSWLWIRRNVKAVVDAL
jgi:hypothetical protein